MALYDINGNVVARGTGASNWTGKTIIFDGDSLTSGYGLPEYVCESLGANCHNIAISGVSIGNSGLGGVGYFRKRLSNYTPDADAIVIHGDLNAGRVAGTIDDLTNTTWFGTWNMFLSHLKVMFPTIPVFLMSTFANSVKSRTMAMEFSEAFRQLAAVHGCIHIDLGTESQFHMVNAKSYNAFSLRGDTMNVHQNKEVAKKYLYSYIAERINQYVPVVTDTPDTGVTIDQTTATVAVGGTVDLAATITPVNGLYQNNAWTTSNGEIALVSGGQVLGVAAGTAIITVKTKSGHAATCVVTVTETATETTA